VLGIDIPFELTGHTDPAIQVQNLRVALLMRSVRSFVDARRCSQRARDGNGDGGGGDRGRCLAVVGNGLALVQALPHPYEPSTSPLARRRRRRRYRLLTELTRAMSRKDDFDPSLTREPGEFVSRDLTEVDLSIAPDIDTLSSSATSCSAVGFAPRTAGRAGPTAPWPITAPPRRGSRGWPLTPRLLQLPPKGSPTAPACKRRTRSARRRRAHRQRRAGIDRRCRPRPIAALAREMSAEL
jgi:hypothetical protein